MKFLVVLLFIKCFLYYNLFTDFKIYVHITRCMKCAETVTPPFSCYLALGQITENHRQLPVDLHNLIL